MPTPYVGEIRLFGFSRIPIGWVACDGSSLSVSQNEVLFNLIGTTYGGNGSTTFNAPDLRGRVPIAQGSGPGLTPRVLGQVAGEVSHMLLQGEMPAHSHALVSTTNAGSTPTPGPSVHLAAANPNTNTLYAAQANVVAYDVMAPSVTLAGGSQPHNNMMPTLTCNYCIATVGIYPTPS